MSVSKALRFQVLRRDNHACRYCGATAPDVKLTVDHVIPATLGGTDTPDNLVAACQGCNGGKSATPPDAALVDDVEQSAVRWARAMEAARDTLRADRQLRDHLRHTFERAWNSWSYEDRAGARQHFELPHSWPTTIDQLAGAGLGDIEIAEAVDIAMRTEKVKDVFKYFCGVGWRMVEQLQKSARAELEGAGGENEPEWIRYEFVTIACHACEAAVRVELEMDADDPSGDAEIIYCGPPPEPMPGSVGALNRQAPGRIRAVWRDTVGPDLNAHARPHSFDNGELALRTDSSAWATQVRLLVRTIARRLNEVLNEDLVQKVTAECPVRHQVGAS